MRKPAARVGDTTQHKKKKLSPGPGSPNIEIEKDRAWRAVVDEHECPEEVPATDLPGKAWDLVDGVSKHGKEKCFLGSFSVLLNGQMAVRREVNLTGEYGPNLITGGATTVEIGDIPFGLAEPVRIAEFCREFKRIMDNWNTLSPTDRIAALEVAINRQLAKSGVPSVSIDAVPFESDLRMGEFSYETWALGINKDLINGPMSAKVRTLLADTVYHEARHAEQWFAMVQHWAAKDDDLSKSEPAKDGVPFVILLSAVLANELFPVTEGTQRGVFARTMNRSIYGSQEDYRERVHDELKKDPSDPINYARYRALPEEADAFGTANLTGGCP
jgi:hypothetical protein